MSEELRAITDFLKDEKAKRSDRTPVEKPDILDRTDLKDWEKPLRDAADRFYTNELLAKGQLDPSEAEYLRRGIVAHLKKGQ
jgi:hypothetical protein